MSEEVQVLKEAHYEAHLRAHERAKWSLFDMIREEENPDGGCLFWDEWKTTSDFLLKQLCEREEFKAFYDEEYAEAYAAVYSEELECARSILGPRK